jgi:hypothetical protein
MAPTKKSNTEDYPSSSFGLRDPKAYGERERSGGQDDDLCVMKREGVGRRAPDLEVNAMLRRTGEQPQGLSLRAA